ncbi:hypothetical protein [Spirosoma pollinicola]|uniref:Uncharacterized protein n=1 Tax=Spirosoma pollinicola TaxID=2057025 RepID=A0A2K8Z9W3_9BACT|nr:hypothetical protein [Spirosoma pollinicola]AUD06647.1 hypothetical protein CWM47_35255 [Spirosoma pollinicola]
MTTINTTDWLLVVKDEEVQWAFLRTALRGILPEVYTVHAPNVVTALSYLQACLLEQRTLPRLILSDLYLSLQPEGFHLVGTIELATFDWRLFLGRFEAKLQFDHG